MNIEDVRAFVAVVDNGSVGKAALRLHVTQPAITRRIQRLEETLGVSLLDRDSKPAKPSRIGESVYQRCLAVLRATDELIAGTTSALPALPLRVGLSYAISECVLAMAMRAVRNHHPAIKLQLSAGTSEDMQEAIANGALDAAVVVARIGHSPQGMRVSPIGEERVAVVTARASPLPSDAEIADLSGYSWIINPHGCGFRRQLERALAEIGSPLNVIAETWGNALQLAMVARGDGLALAPERLVKSSSYRDQLRIVNVRCFEPKVAVAMIRGDVPPAFAQALDTMAEAVKAVLNATGSREKRGAEPQVRSGTGAA